MNGFRTRGWERERGGGGGGMYTGKAGYFRI